jgi:hypothetical protein
MHYTRKLYGPSWRGGWSLDKTTHDIVTSSTEQFSEP